MKSFDQKCKHCSCDMYTISSYSDGVMSGSYMIYWCPNCGTIVHFYEGAGSYIPKDDAWSYPMLLKVQTDSTLPEVKKIDT
jgi:Zn-finger protein